MDNRTHTNANREKEMRARIESKTGICTQRFEAASQFDRMEEIILQAEVGLLTESEAIQLIRAI